MARTPDPQGRPSSASEAGHSERSEGALRRLRRIRADLQALAADVERQAHPGDVLFPLADLRAEMAAVRQDLVDRELKRSLHVLAGAPDLESCKREAYRLSELYSMTLGRLIPRERRG